jgi:hypothetical protein
LPAEPWRRLWAGRLPRRARQISGGVRKCEDARVVALLFGFVGGASKPARRFRNITAHFEPVSRFEGCENVIRIARRWRWCAQCRYERSELRHDRYVARQRRFEQMTAIGIARRFSHLQLDS